MSFRKWRILGGALLTAALLSAACGGGSSDSTEPSTAASEPTAAPEPTTAPLPTAAPEPTTGPEPTAAPTEEPAATATPIPTAAPAPTAEPELVRGEILESFVGNIAMSYPTGPAVDGEVRVYFNNGTDGTLVAIYHGPGLSDPTGLCPGNSLNAGGFMFVSNAPASEGACDGFPTEVGSVRVCTSNVWLYNTRIPNDSAGDVFGSLEKLVEGTYLGGTAIATNQPGTPPIDYAADVYDISPMFTIDGATEITCLPALT